MAREVLGQLRLDLGRPPVSEGLAFTWIVDFPLFEGLDDDGRPIPAHHAFTVPHPDDVDRLESDPLSVRSRSYDLVLNGWELGSGSVRIHRPDMQQRIFSLLGIEPEDAQQALRLPARRVPLRRAAPRRVRGRHRPPRRDPRRRGEHPRGHRVPEDAVRRRPPHQRPHRRSTTPNSATSASDSSRRPRSNPANCTISWRVNAPCVLDRAITCCERWSGGRERANLMVSQATRSVAAHGMQSSTSRSMNIASRQWSLVTRQQLHRSRTSRPAGSRRSCGRECASAGAAAACTRRSDRSRAWQQDAHGCVFSASATVPSPRTAAAARLVGATSTARRAAVEVTVESDRRSADDVASTARRSCPTRTSRRAPASRARASNARSATARRCSRRSSSVACSTTDCAAATRRSTRLRRCAARLDSGPGRRLGVIKELLAERDASFDPGGSASELHVLQVIREAGLPDAGPAAPGPGRRTRPTCSTSRGPSSGCFAEYYGLAVHSGASAVAYDSERLTALVGAGLASARLHRRHAGPRRSSETWQTRCSKHTIRLARLSGRMSA